MSDTDAMIRVALQQVGVFEPFAQEARRLGMTLREFLTNLANTFPTVGSAESRMRCVDTDSKSYPEKDNFKTAERALKEFEELGLRDHDAFMTMMREEFADNGGELLSPEEAREICRD